MSDKSTDVYLRLFRYRRQYWARLSQLTATNEDKVLKDVQLSKKEYGELASELGIGQYIIPLPTDRIKQFVVDNLTASDFNA